MDATTARVIARERKIKIIVKASRMLIKRLKREIERASKLGKTEIKLSLRLFYMSEGNFCDEILNVIERYFSDYGYKVYVGSSYIIFDWNDQNNT